MPLPSDLSFEALNLSPETLKAVHDMGFVRPTQVQAAAYTPVLEGHDIMVQSHTGSGKTVAYGMPLAEMLNTLDRQVQALILLPTRELANQVAEELSKLFAHRALSVAAVYGGAGMGGQIAELKNGVQVVAGTPGRLLDHLKRRTLSLSGLRILILDEADEMLSMGFAKDLDAILEFLPKERQSLLFSATIPEDIRALAQRFLHNPEMVSLSKKSTPKEVTHYCYMVSGMGKQRDLVRVLKSVEPEDAIIFCNTREDTHFIASYLRRQGFDAEEISGDLPQSEREIVMGKIKRKELRFLVATDVAARGIDISELSHVINYSIPEYHEVYIHRTGRTGRAGRSGTAISLVSPQELGNFVMIRKIYKIETTERELPPDGALIESTAKQLTIPVEAPKQLEATKPPAALPQKSTTRAETKTKTEAKPKAQTKVEPKAEAKTEAKAEAKPEPKIEVSAEANTEPKLKAETKPEPEIKPEAKVEPKVETAPEIKTETAPEAIAEEKQSKPEPKIEVKPEPKVEVSAEANTEPKLKAETKPEPAPEAKAEPKPTRAESKIEVKPEIKSEPKQEHKAPERREAEAKADPRQEPKLPTLPNETWGDALDILLSPKEILGRFDTKQAEAPRQQEPKQQQEPRQQEPRNHQRRESEHNRDAKRQEPKQENKRPSQSNLELSSPSWAELKGTDNTLPTIEIATLPQDEPLLPDQEDTTQPVNGDIAAAFAEALRETIQGQAEQPESQAAEDTEDEGEGDDVEGQENVKMTRLYLNLGRRDHVRASEVTRFLRDHVKLTRRDLGRVQVRDTFSHVGIRLELAEQLVKSLNGQKFRNKEVIAELAKQSPPRQKNPNHNHPQEEKSPEAAIDTANFALVAIGPEITQEPAPLEATPESTPKDATELATPSQEETPKS